MSASALTHYAKIRGSITENYKHLRRNKRHRESGTEKQCLQQLRLQTLVPLGKELHVDLQRRPPRTLSPPPKCSTPIYSKMSRHDTSHDQHILAGIPPQPVLHICLCRLHLNTAQTLGTTPNLVLRKCLCKTHLEGQKHWASLQSLSSAGACARRRWKQRLYSKDVCAGH